MEFTTRITINKQDFVISHKSKLMVLGSCFAENIGNILLDNKFDINLNPFGIVYNPQSLQQSLEILLREEKINQEDLFKNEGLYHNFHFHGRFSDADSEQALSKMDNSVSEAAQVLKNADFLILTLGTSYIYKLKSTQSVVSNCHKLPGNLFSRNILSVEQITKSWSELLKMLHGLNPKMKVIFTVSPIRHLRDGAHQNQLSKSVLLLAVEELCIRFSFCSYFPSYEIVLDELRDYRFYADDMVHPNQTAINYLWERFSETYFNEETIRINNEWSKIQSALRHRPINSDSKEHKHFLKQTFLKLKLFQEKYSYIYCYKEIAELEEKIKSIENLNQV